VSPPMSPLRFAPLDHASALAFLVYSSSAVITPICLVILAQEIGFSLAQGGGIELARGMIIFVVLLASGFAAGRWGKALSIGVSLLILGAGLVLYAVAPSYGVIIIAAGLLGVGGGVVEGLLNPLVQDLHPTESGRYLNILNAFWSIGVLVTVLVTGELLTQAVSWRAIIAVLGAVSVVSGGLFFLLMHTQGPHTESNPFEVLRHKWATLRSARFWLFVPMMFLAGGAEGAYTFWSASYIQLNYSGLPRAAGIGTACFAGGMIAGRLAWGWLVRQHRLRRLIFLSAVAGMLVSIAVPMIGLLWQLYVVLLLAGLSIACFWPSIQSYAADRISVDSTALFILLSCAGIPGFAAMSWVMGIIGDRWGLAASFYIVPVSLGGVAVLIAVERAWRPTTSRTIEHG
jgi:fucose permease